MVGPASSYNARRPSPGSILDRWLARHTPHPDSFDCGVRVLRGSVATEGRRWRYRRSAVDPLHRGGIVTLNHGTRITLQLAVDPGSIDYGRRGNARTGFVVLSAVERVTGADVEVSVPVGELERFGLAPY